MSFQGVIQNKVKGGLVSEGTSERTVVLICGMSPSSGVKLLEPIELYDSNVASSLGITEDTDLTKKELTAYHISEMFRIAPDSTFYLLPVAKTEKISTLVTKSDFINALRLIPGVAIVGFASVASDASIGVAVRAAQTLVDNMAAEFIYIDSALIEGVGSYIEGAITGFSDLREFDCENVSVIISQDPDIASQDSAYSTHASIGTALGSLAVRAIHENLGSVDIEVKPRSKRGTADYSLTSQKEERFLSSALSNGIPFNQISASLQKKLTELGYIYAGSFAGYSGVFFSNSCTCCEADSDYAFIERNGIWNAAARLIRKTMIPRIRGKVEADPTTGYVKSTTLSDWDGRVRKSLETMITAGNIADFDIYINPKQVAVSNKPFALQVKLVADGIAHEFEVDLGLTNKI